MKFERERDILAFKGKDWREKWVLRNRAEDRDPSIRRVKVLIGYVIFPLMTGALWCAAYQFFPHFRVLAGIALNVTVGSAIETVLYSLLVVPRIRKAMELQT